MMIKRANAKRSSRFACLALAVVLATMVHAAVVRAAEQQIPTDARGLPQWTIKEWTDFPITVELGSRDELEALLRAVPIASFDRDQVRVIRDGPLSSRLLFRPRVTEAEEAALLEHGYRTARLPDLDRQGREAAERTWAGQSATGNEALARGDKAVWHTYAEIVTILAQIGTDHPMLARTFTWGATVQGRELRGLVISADVSNTTAEPEVRLSSTIHGNEPVGAEMLLYLADYLTDHYGQVGYEDVTYLVDHYEIHLLPMYNPDGNVADSRYNANGVDLNRNFLEPAGTQPVLQLENAHFEAHARAHHFVVSINGHGGATVANYPWDHTYTRAPDDAAVQKLSLEYSTYNLPMYNGDFPQGITNGADWYVITGSLQDWSYDQTDCIDVTVELQDTSWPPASQLDGLWNDNRESLMHYVKAARYGINGVVTSAATGLPLAAIVAVAGNAKPVHTDPAHGDYYKLLNTGTYELTFAATGCVSQTVSGVATTWGTPTVLNVALLPDAPTGVPGAAPLAFTLDPVRPNPARGGALTVRFTLPTTAPARLELLDVSGRRITSQDVGAGQHTLDLGRGRQLAPGLYLVRLTQGANTRTTRVAVLQ